MSSTDIPAAAERQAIALAELAELRDAVGDPRNGDSRSVPFEGSQVRGRFHKGAWWLSVIDIITALGVSTQPSRYWGELRDKLIDVEGFSELFGKIEKLKMPSADGKLRATEAADIRTLLRILQSVPSPRLEPLKQWLAYVGYERLQETDDHSNALERLINAYLAKGRTPEWIRERIDGIITRRELTHEWRDRGIKMRNHYADLDPHAPDQITGCWTEGASDHERAIEAYVAS